MDVQIASIFILAVVNNANINMWVQGWYGLVL